HVLALHQHQQRVELAQRGGESRRVLALGVQGVPEHRLRDLDVVLALVVGVRGGVHVADYGRKWLAESSQTQPHVRRGGPGCYAAVSRAPSAEHRRVDCPWRRGTTSTRACVGSCPGRRPVSGRRGTTSTAGT